MQHFEQALAVEAQVELFGIDHDIGKNSIVPALDLFIVLLHEKIHPHLSLSGPDSHNNTSLSTSL